MFMFSISDFEVCKGVFSIKVIIDKGKGIDFGV